MKIKEFELSVLKMEPGDILVMKTKHPVPAEDQKWLLSILPSGCNALFIADNVELSVLKAKEYDGKD